jgi:hypothetical protein
LIKRLDTVCTKSIGLSFRTLTNYLTKSNRKFVGYQKTRKIHGFYFSSSLPRTLNLSEHGLTYKGSLVACPICLTLYTEHALNQEIENPLTIEHIPPESLGGKRLILTCKNCNNNAGKLDKRLLDYTKTKDFYEFKPESKVEANIQLNGRHLVKTEIIFKVTILFI